MNRIRECPLQPLRRHLLDTLRDNGIARRVAHTALVAGIMHRIRHRLLDALGQLLLRLFGDDGGARGVGLVRGAGHGGCGCEGAGDGAESGCCAGCEEAEVLHVGEWCSWEGEDGIFICLYGELVWVDLEGEVLDVRCDDDWILLESYGTVVDTCNRCWVLTLPSLQSSMMRRLSSFRGARPPVEAAVLVSCCISLTSHPWRGRGLTSRLVRIAKC
jgi:hypothetical protein